MGSLNRTHYSKLVHIVFWTVLHLLPLVHIHSKRQELIRWSFFSFVLRSVRSCFSPVHTGALFHSFPKYCCKPFPANARIISSSCWKITGESCLCRYKIMPWTCSVLFRDKFFLVHSVNLPSLFKLLLPLMPPLSLVYCAHLCNRIKGLWLL